LFAHKPPARNFRQKTCYNSNPNPKPDTTQKPKPMQAQFSTIISSAKTILRAKLRKSALTDSPTTPALCSYTDVLLTLPPSQKHAYGMSTPAFKSTLSDFLKNNPKLIFDLKTEKFQFQKIFLSKNDFLDQIYLKKIGIPYDEDLFDDVPKHYIDILISSNFCRKIETNDRKIASSSYANTAQKNKFVLFSKNYWDDDIEKIGYGDMDFGKLRG
jgi:hypothetical protein